MRLRLWLALAVCLALALAGSAWAGDQSQKKESSQETDLIRELEEDFSSRDRSAVADPLEPYNRVVFRFNDGLYSYVLIPVSNGYKAVMPSPFRQGMENAFHNVRFPGRMVNHLLQGRPLRSAKEVAGFVINTLFGFGGLLKPADSIPGLSPPEKDTGTTLGTWGVGQGVYIVWPVLGPSTLRSSTGMVGDYFLDPLFYLEGDELGWWLTGTENINKLPSLMGRYEDMKDFGIEPYSSVKDGYVQYRREKVRK
ncbi:MAG: VacJ family lipoprotein [Desulfohalobiaceae bacterium]|nr:VacJ family lipoprotein [Desulfohalobiaceae bacterium]